MDEVVDPDSGTPRSQSWWESWLDSRFAHTGFLRLNRKWKRAHFHDCASEIRIALIEPYIDALQLIEELQEERTDILFWLEHQADLFREADMDDNVRQVVDRVIDEITSLPITALKREMSGRSGVGKRQDHPGARRSTLGLQADDGGPAGGSPHPTRLDQVHPRTSEERDPGEVDGSVQ